MKALIVSYGVGNLFSISSSLRRVGFNVDIARDPDRRWRDYEIIVFPGVGTFSAVATYFDRERRGVFDDIRKSGVHFLGICVGMQIMFEYGFEGGFYRGLGWFRGYVDKLVTNSKLPHIGWDEIYMIRNTDDYCQLFSEIDKGFVYFMHSYAAYPTESNYICMVCYYGREFPALVVKENIIGVQFHPEKSSKVGLNFLNTLVRWLRC